MTMFLLLLSPAEIIILVTRVLPRRNRMVETFAKHVASDAKQLIEDEETGAQKYRYLRTGADHFSLALTYDSVAWMGEHPAYALMGRVPIAIIG